MFPLVSLSLLLVLLLVLLLLLLPSASTAAFEPGDDLLGGSDPFFLSEKGRRAKSSSDTRVALDLSTIAFSPVSSILKTPAEAGVSHADRR